MPGHDLYDRFNSNEDAPAAKYSFEISLTTQEIEDLVTYAHGGEVNIKYVIQNILDDINPEVYVRW